MSTWGENPIDITSRVLYAGGVNRAFSPGRKTVWHRVLNR